MFGNVTLVEMNGYLSDAAKQEIILTVSKMPESVINLVNNRSFMGCYLFSNTVAFINMLSDFVMNNLDDVAKLNYIFVDIKDVFNRHYDNIIKWKVAISDAYKFRNGPAASKLSNADGKSKKCSRKGKQQSPQ